MEIIKHGNYEIALESVSLEESGIVRDDVYLVMRTGRHGWYGLKEAVAFAREEGEGPFKQLIELSEELIRHQRALAEYLEDGEYDDSLLEIIEECREASLAVREAACSNPVLSHPDNIHVLDRVLDVVDWLGEHTLPTRAWDFDDALKRRVVDFSQFHTRGMFLSEVVGCAPDEVRDGDDVEFFMRYTAEACGWRRLPVYRYEHSGVALSCSPFGCRWDSGQAGWVYTKESKEDVSDDEIRAYVTDFGRVLNGDLVRAWVVGEDFCEEHFYADEGIAAAKQFIDKLEAAEAAKENSE